MFVNVTTSHSQSSFEWVERVLSLTLQTMYTVTGAKSLVESGLVPTFSRVQDTELSDISEQRGLVFCVGSDSVDTGDCAYIVRIDRGHIGKYRCVFDYCVETESRV